MFIELSKKIAREAQRGYAYRDHLISTRDLEALGEAMGMPAERTPMFGKIASGPDKGKRIPVGHSIHIPIEVRAAGSRAKDRGMAIANRHDRFRRYMREDRHDWQIIDTIHFGDNSIEVVEKSRLTGETRQRMTTAPHGDLCY